MDTQRKKGLLDICVLAALMREPSYGYRIVSDLEPVIDVSESTLYPILRRLEKNGSVSTYSQEHNGRLRKYYRIEEPGRERVRTFLDEADEMRRIYTYAEEASK